MCTQIYPFLVVNVSISLLWFLGTDRCTGAAGEEPTGDFGGGNSALEPGEAVGDPQNEDVYNGKSYDINDLGIAP